MTQTHPLTPSDELLEHWRAIGYTGNWQNALTQAAQWGADQQLEAACEWLVQEAYIDAPCRLHAHMRPKPPSLKKQALEVLMKADGADHPVPVLVLPIEDAVVIRRALEALDD